MSTSTIWIVIAALVVIAVIAVIALALNRGNRRRRQRQAEEIREQARLETAELERRQALADETAAKARAAQAEAEVKAAEAARLQEQAAAHQNEAATSREALREQWERADNIDPTVRRDRRDEDTDRTDTGGDEAWSDEVPATPGVDNPSTGTAVNYRRAST